MRQWSCIAPLFVAFATLANPAVAVESAAEADPPQAASLGKLDLRVPPITELYTPEQIAAVLANTRDPDVDEVEVEGHREPAPPAAPSIWGRVWSVFAPVSSDRAEDVASRSLRARAYYIEPAARTALDL
jgi:hypothetical protein